MLLADMAATLDENAIMGIHTNISIFSHIPAAAEAPSPKPFMTAVTNTIGRIRQKIEDDRSAPVYIRTISNLGYQFMPNVLVEKDSL